MRNNSRASGEPLLPPVVQISLQPLPTPVFACSFQDYIELLRNIAQPADYVQHNVYVLLFDAWDGLLGHYHLARGTQSNVELDMNLLLNMCLALRPDKVVIGHCMPQPATYPSDALLHKLETIIQAVRMVNVRLEDYIIFNLQEDASTRFNTSDHDVANIYMITELQGPPYLLENG